MILLLTLSILILSIGMVSASDADLSNSNLSIDDSSAIGISESSEISTGIAYPDLEIADNTNVYGDNETDIGDDDDNDTNESGTGYITPEINETEDDDNITDPGKLYGKTYINIVNNAFEIDEIGSLPITYDIRDYGWVTPVKNQGSSGSCWTFASTAALESFLLKSEGVEYDFSENNMKNIMGSYSVNGTDFGPNDGGNEVMILAYFTRWDGAINETDDPYEPSSTRSPYNLTRVKYVQDVLLVPKRTSPTDNDQIKWALMNYGALYTGIYWDTSYEKGDSYYYYGTYPYGNHAIAIVGWDDTYSASNFKYQPAGDGAFIIKNSWGESEGDGGYYYISYYDMVFAGRGSNEYFSAMAFTNAVETTYYKQNYYYDVYGNTFDAVGYKNETAWFANDFTATSDNPLKAVGFYSYGTSTYTANIYVNNYLKYSQSGSVKGAGYHTVELDQMVNIYRGEQFRVAIKLTTPNCDYPIAIENYHSSFTGNASAKAGQSFVSSNGRSWEDLTTVSGYSKANVCLKAYTAYASNIEMIANTNVSYYSNGDQVELMVSLTNKGDLSSANLYSQLDENVKIVSYVSTGGTFDVNSKIWTIDEMDTDSKYVLRLFLQVNTKQANITNSLILNSSLYNMNRNTSNITLFKRVSAQLDASALKTAYNSGDLFNVLIVDEDMEALDDVEVCFKVYNSNNVLIGTFYNFTNEEGRVFLDSNFNAGNYTVKVSLVNPYYEGDLVGSIAISKASTKVTAINNNAVLNRSTTITANVDSEGKIVNEGSVSFYVNGMKIGTGDVVDGVAYVDYIHSKVGDFEINAIYSENGNYLQSDNLASLKVEKITANFEGSDIISTYKDLDSYNLTVMDDEYNRVSGVNIRFNIYQNGDLLANNYISTDSEGIARLSVDLSAGDYIIESEIINNEYQGSNNNSLTLNKATAKLVASQIGNQYKNTQLTVKLSQAITDKVYTNQKVLISFSNGRIYSLTTDSNGEADLDIDFDAGEYTYQLSSSNSNIIAKSAGKITIEKSKAAIDAEIISNTYKNSVIEASLKDKSNNALGNRQISLTINGKTYTETSDNNGIATFELDLDAGKYAVSVKSSDIDYESDEKALNIEIVPAKAIISGESIQKYYNDEGKISISIKDSENNPLSNMAIVYTVNAVDYTASTDDEGNAALDVDELPGNYTVQIKLDDKNYEGESTVNAEVLAIPSQIVAKNLVKYFKNNTQLSITLKDNNGNVLAGEKISFTISGKTYTKTTDAKGMASLTINNKVGSYSTKISFSAAGYKSVSKTVTVKVVSPKITAATSVKKGKTFAVVFKDANGKIIKNKKVIVKIGSKTYTRTTNSKGQALIKISLKKGKYTVKSSFASSALYGTTVKTTKLTVK